MKKRAAKKLKPKYVAMAVGGGFPVLLESNEGFDSVERFAKGCYRFTYEKPIPLGEVTIIVHLLPPGIMAILEDQDPYGCTVHTFKIGKKALPRDASFRVEVIRIAAPRKVRQ